MDSLARRLSFTIAFILLGVYGYLTLSGPQGIPALSAKRREIRQLEEENANLTRENDSKRVRLDNLRLKPSEQDLEIRKKLKMLRKNETEFILPNSPSSVKPDALPAPIE